MHSLDKIPSQFLPQVHSHPFSHFLPIPFPVSFMNFFPFTLQFLLNSFSFFHKFLTIPFQAFFINSFQFLRSYLYSIPSFFHIPFHSNPKFFLSFFLGYFPEFLPYSILFHTQFHAKIVEETGGHGRFLAPIQEGACMSESLK